MIKYLFNRVMWMIPTFLGITFISFFVMRLAPNTESQMQLLLAGSNVSVEDLKSLEVEPTKDYIPDFLRHTVQGTALILNPLTRTVNETLFYQRVNFVFKSVHDYLSWLRNIFRLDFGYSSKDYRPVFDKILESLPITLLLNVLSLILIYGVSLPLGVWAARHHGETRERWLILKLFFLYSLPTFWVASLLLVYLAGGDYLNWFPLGGLHSTGFEDFNLWQKFFDVSWHLMLPVLVMSLASIAFMTRFTQENLLEVLHKPFVRTARAKGLKPRRVLIFHALRNALLPFVTLLGTLLPGLLGGSVIVEQIFSIPGMGALSFTAVMTRDYNVVMAITALSAVLTLIGMLLQDLLYAVLDPRIELTETA